MGAFRILRYHIDAISVMTVILALGVQLAAFWMAWPWYTLFLIILLARQVNLVEHNHAHLRIFSHTFLNESFGFLCFLSNGTPFEFYKIHHVKNHHAHNQRFDEESRDWSSLFGFTGTRYPDRPVNRFYYILSFPLITICHCLIEILRAPGSRIFWSFGRSMSLIAVISAILIAVDPWRFLFFFVLPWLVVCFGLGQSNYAHHHGCRLSTPYDSANVSLRLPYRLIGFHIGYHVAHHMKPNLHWSLLPQYHESIKENIPPENYHPRPVPQDANGPS